jgi:hypothetical protein
MLKAQNSKLASLQAGSKLATCIAQPTTHISQPKKQNKKRVHGFLLVLPGNNSE